MTKKRRFILEKYGGGHCKIKIQGTDKTEIGFKHPDFSGIKFIEMLKKLEDGDRIIVKKEA